MGRTRTEVTGMLLAAVATMVSISLWGWRPRQHAVPVTLTATQLQTALDVFAPVPTFTNWSQQLVQRGIQTPVPVGVSWAWAANDVALPRRNLVTSGSLSTDPKPLLPKSGAGGADQILDSGLVTRLHDDLYARLCPADWF